MESTSKYDPNIIRNQLKTIKMIQVSINSQIKVIENYVLPILPEKFRVIFELKKDTSLKTLKEFKTDFGDQDIEVLKKKYKEKNNKLYDLIVLEVNLKGELTNFRLIYHFLYSCFIVLKRETIVNLTKYKLMVHDRCNCNYNSDLDKFISTNFPVDKICLDITKKLYSNCIFHTISKQYYKNLALYKYITSCNPIDYY
jgi:hypothetical protein